MKILGLMLVLGIGVFLIWFFEEIFKDSSEEDYEDYVYEMPRKAASGRPVRRTPGAAGISAAEGCPVAARRPVAASCNERTGQSYRKTA